MTQPTAIGSFFTGGGKGITWPDNPPKTISGTITAVHPPEPVQDPKTGLPTDKQQIRIELATNERNPEIDFDDGARTLYVKSWMRSAIGDALKKIGEKEPKIGGMLTVTFTHLEAPERPGLSPSKHFDVQYTPPAVTGDFFGNGVQGQAQPAQPPYAPPPPQQYASGGYVTPPPQPVQPQPQPQYAAPPQQRYASPAPQQAPPQQPGPQKPAQISDAAWAAMDDATRRVVAGAVDAPPF